MHRSIRAICSGSLLITHSTPVHYRSSCTPAAALLWKSSLLSLYCALHYQSSRHCGYKSDCASSGFFHFQFLFSWNSRQNRVRHGLPAAPKAMLAALTHSVSLLGVPGKPRIHRALRIHNGTTKHSSQQDVFLGFITFFSPQLLRLIPNLILEV